MNKKLRDLLLHLERFVNGADRSVDWAKTAEFLIDGLDHIDESLENFHHDLAFYRPGGGDHLLDEIEMKPRCEAILKKYDSDA